MKTPSTRNFITSLGVLLALATASVSNAQGMLKRLDDHTPENIEKAKLLGVLTYTRVTATWEEKPLRDALAELSTALNITIVGRYDDHPKGHGLDARMPVTIDARQQCALDLLEEMLEQCEVYEDCTWQIRGGKVEVGTKRRLASFSARENRRYDITDLLIEPPYFISPDEIRKGNNKFNKVTGPYVEAILGESDRECLRTGKPPMRKNPNMIALEIVEGIVEVIEPGRWDFGHRPPDAEPAPVEAPQPTSGPEAQHSPIQVRDPSKWASIRVFQKTLMIQAPDFIHRQIGGYPPPTMPEVLEVDANPQTPDGTASPRKSKRIVPGAPSRQ
jgi:hypothetical protein